MSDRSEHRADNSIRNSTGENSTSGNSTFGKGRSSRPKEPSPPFEPAALLTDAFKEEYGTVFAVSDKERVLEKHFDLKAVESETDIRSGGVYCYKSKLGLDLIQVESDESEKSEKSEEFDAEAVPLILALTGGKQRPASFEALVSLGRNQKLHRLAPKTKREDTVAPSETSSRKHVFTGHPENSSISDASFTHLLSAVEKSGFDINTHAIVDARNREFKVGRYQKAFDIIEILYKRFSTEADRRAQRLRQEETKYRSGKLKMSPKDWQNKKARDIAETQRVERARRHFTHVLGGLRVLWAAEESKNLSAN